MSLRQTIQNHLFLVYGFIFLFGGNLLILFFLYPDYQRYYYPDKNLHLIEVQGILDNKIILESQDKKINGAIYLKLLDEQNTYLELWCDNIKSSLFGSIKSYSKKKEIGTCNQVFDVDRLHNYPVQIIFDKQTSMLYELRSIDGKVIVDKNFMIFYYQKGFFNKNLFIILVLVIILIGYGISFYFSNKDSFKKLNNLN